MKSVPTLRVSILGYSPVCPGSPPGFPSGIYHEDLATRGQSIFVAGYYGFGNAGDELILHCIVEQLRALKPALEIAVASGNPESTSARHAVRAVPWTDIDALTQAVEQCGLV